MLVKSAPLQKFNPNFKQVFISCSHPFPSFLLFSFLVLNFFFIFLIICKNICFGSEDQTLINFDTKCIWTSFLLFLFYVLSFILGCKWQSRSLCLTDLYFLCQYNPNFRLFLTYQSVTTVMKPISNKSC
jgi:hypothetical protein